MVVMMDGGNGTTVPIVLPKELEVYLEQQVGDNVPRMVIGKRPSGDVLLQCAPTEAMHLGNALLRLAAMAMGGKMMECGECEGHEA
ncbi:hypothetical protein EV192_104657 [Actinocrispum wychmicini]|uniref:Uncharacterized protein n=1 Tax=Actinocrispum wychmicini TaxID=1213861 RepID=A0A4R2JKW9_9PSEU|nr:hypothetical protein EV192_104657 [Actinocrispum wychmicini]